MSVFYYRHDNIPCRVMRDGDGVQIAEGYFPGDGGFASVSVMHVLWYGELITEKKFKEIVAAQSIMQRRKKRGG